MAFKSLFLLSVNHHSLSIKMIWESSFQYHWFDISIIKIPSPASRCSNSQWKLWLVLPWSSPQVGRLCNTFCNLSDGGEMRQKILILALQCSWLFLVNIKRTFLQCLCTSCASTGNPSRAGSPPPWRTAPLLFSGCLLCCLPIKKTRCSITTPDKSARGNYIYQWGA